MKWYISKNLQAGQALADNYYKPVLWKIISPNGETLLACQVDAISVQAMAVRQRRQGTARASWKNSEIIFLPSASCVLSASALFSLRTVKPPWKVSSRWWTRTAAKQPLFFADVTSRQALIRKVREHFTDYIEVPVSKRRTSLDPDVESSHPRSPGY